MSEINSIANGSFVLGQTSATNFIAGPGIKIDEPSAGTVRIGNDETVLWSGTSDFKILETSAVLSDNLLNFKYVDLYVRAWERIQVIRKELYTPALTPTLQCMIGWNEPAGNRIVGMNYVYNSADNSITRSACALNTINGTTITSASIASNAGGIYKIVGIGRKQ